MNTIVEQAVLAAVRRQSFYQRYANTIVAGLGAVAALLTFIATLPVIDNTWAQALPVVVAGLTTIAVKLTPNGVSPAMAEQIAAQAPGTGHLPTYPMGTSIPAAPRPLPAYAGDTSIPYTGRHRSQP